MESQLEGPVMAPCAPPPPRPPPATPPPPAPPAPPPSPVTAPSCPEGRVEKVQRSLCRAATRPCRVLAEVLDPLPAFLNCSDDAVYSDDCSDDTRSKRARFNA